MKDKQYPKYPPKPTSGKSAKYGDEGCPRITKEEIDIAKRVFSDIYVFGKDKDPHTLFAHALNCSRTRAKQVCYWVLYQKGSLVQDTMLRERKVRAKLTGRIKKYSEFLENPETAYQIISRAQDEVDQDEVEKAARKKENHDKT